MIDLRLKKLTSVFLLGSVGLSLAACGGGGSSGGTAAGPVVTPPPPPPPPVTPPPPPVSPPPVPAPSDGPFGVSNPFALPNATDVTNVRVDTLHAFGDSNSVVSRNGISGWPGYLQAQGYARDVVNNANSGGFGGTDPDENNTFQRQLDRAFGEGGAGVTIADRDLVAVFFGANDVEKTSPGQLDASIAAFQEGLDALKGLGATDEQRRLFIATLFDLNRTPGFRGQGLTDEVRRWNDAVRAYANANPNAVAVDLFTVFERVFADPARYGFDDVTNPVPTRTELLDPDSPYLWADEQHLTQHGQNIVGQVFQHYLTRGWDWANALSAGAAAQARLEQDLSAGQVIAQGATGTPGATAGLGLVAVPLGAPGSGSDAGSLDQSRAGFAAVQAPADGGAAFELRGADQTIGFAFGRYREAVASDKNLARHATGLDAEAFALYARREVGGLDLDTRVSTTAMDFSRRDLDGVADSYGRTDYGGRASAVTTRLTAPMYAGGAWLRPWAELGWRRQGIDGYTQDDAYLGPVRYEASAASEMVGGLGLDLVLKPIDLGSGRTLTFGGDLGLNRTFGRGDLKVRVSDAGGSGEAVVPRDETTSATLNLNGSLSLSERFDLTTGLGLVGNDAAGTEAGVSVGGRLRF